MKNSIVLIKIKIKNIVSLTGKAMNRWVTSPRVKSWFPQVFMILWCIKYLGFKFKIR